MKLVNLTITSPSTISSPQGNAFQAAYQAAYGTAAEPYSNYAYDNAWIAMFAALSAGSYNGQTLLGIMPTVADHYYGATGTGIWLDQNGDQTIAYYDILQCVQNGTSYMFTAIGSYNGGLNTVTLNSK